MYQFIYLLRILAAILITNSHYESIYPLSLLANGGLLGDVLFFAISGYCLFLINQRFDRWFGKRLWRIYPAVWIVTLCYILLRFYPVSGVGEFFQLILYPTYYHFVASILLLYILYYGLSKLLTFKDGYQNRRLLVVGILIAAVYFLLYYTIYDRSYYHLDSVHEPMIRFLFLFSMLIGLYFRANSARFLGQNQIGSWLASLGLCILYFASKLLFSKGYLPCEWQWINQLILLLLLAALFRAFMGLESKLSAIPEKRMRIFRFCAGMTFEIYLVQYPLIPRLNIGVFPLNFLLVSGAIFISAWILHILSDAVIRFPGKFRAKVK